jgi:hypothetical protein
MEISNLKNGSLTILDAGQFENIKVKQFRPGYSLTDLKYLRDKAGNERNLRESYRGRAPYELLQNADDAKAKTVAYILCSEGMAFVHDGNWFTTENFISLADGWSDKNPNECIGHKGLGFRSVLDITPSPYLVWMNEKTFFAVKFTWALNNGHFNEVLERDPSIKGQVEAWKKSGQLIVPIMCIPGQARKANLGKGATLFDRLLRGGYKQRFTTMFWFPANDRDIDPKTLADLKPMPVTANSDEQTKLQNYISDEVSVLLPFLKNVKSVYLYVDETMLTSVTKAYDDKKVQEKLTIVCEKNQHKKELSFFQMSFRTSVPPEISRDKATPRALENMKEVGITVSVRLNEDQPVSMSESKFHVYFPTKEQTGMGFIVHGDFFVKPDRTEIMAGNYNEWLLGFAARKIANEYMNALLKNYDAKHVFGALAPVFKGGKIAEIFRNKFSDALRKRKVMFLPYRSGQGNGETVILPPDIDESGFWENHFDGVSISCGNRKHFISPAVDDRLTRKFFELAGVETMKPVQIIDLIEAISDQDKSPEWWYRVFDFMAHDKEISVLGSAQFKGRRLIPSFGKQVLKVGEDGGVIISFPPVAEHKSITVPPCFEEILTFLDNDLSVIIKSGDDLTRKWIVESLSITNFEANELIPKAIRGIVKYIYSGEKAIAPKELVTIWSFIKTITEISRTQISYEKYWYEIGRFPLPVTFDDKAGKLDPATLAPAFLMYSSESFAMEESCLSGIDGIRRVDELFLKQLALASESSVDDCKEFLKRAGVSGIPKILTYKRFVQEEEIPFTDMGPRGLSRMAFTGERQLDENYAVVLSLQADGIWEEYVGQQGLGCGHDSQKVLHSLTVIEGLKPCCEMAVREFEEENNNWGARLWLLIRGMKVNGDVSSDSVYCKGGKGGHDIPIKNYLEFQRETIRWLPSSIGPANGTECFVRWSGNPGIISLGKSTENLGDMLLPSVVVPSYEDAMKLQGFGVESLDNIEQANIATLLRALREIGKKLSSDWGRQHILDERGRWRLVRGAIQEIYRRLNQDKYLSDIANDIFVAVKTVDGINFQAPPIYYAKPGSAIERAFLGKLSLIDVDRHLKELFSTFKVVSLMGEGAVKEELLSQDACAPCVRIRDTIINELAPYLLAAVVDKGEKETDRIIKRLKERFEVVTSESLMVSVFLTEDPTMGDTIHFRNFYLNRRTVQLTSAIEEYHFTLYVEGPNSLSFADIDADALGEVLSHVFTDRVTDEILGFFPRITSRFQKAMKVADPSFMEDYLHLQLGISRETQSAAKSMFQGDYVVPSRVIPPPPKAVHIEFKPAADAGATNENMDALFDKHQNELNKKAEKMLEGLGQKQFGSEGGGGKDGGKDRGKKAGGGGGGLAAKVSFDQKQRGLRGEEEFKRRLSTKGGWEGFELSKDTRNDGCGYDFLCNKGGETVKVEIKTFTEKGYISVTNLELIEAFKSGLSYYLIGIMDTGGPEFEWRSFILRAPADHLLRLGTFEIETRLQLGAEEFLGLCAR